MSKLREIQYNCKKATYLIEKRMLDKITFREKIELRIHLAGCSVCRLFDQQSQIINKLTRQLFHDRSKNITLDDEYKNQLHQQIEKELQEN